LVHIPYWVLMLVQIPLLPMDMQYMLGMVLVALQIIFLVALQTHQVHIQLELPEIKAY
jgi:hypothetical protein